VTWLNPWALLGLGAVVAPVLIHLFARHRARTLKFPTLRFVRAAAVTPTRRRRITDPWLMLLRVCIVALAAAALAQPHVPSRDTTPASARRSIARAVIVDTSASMATALTAARPVADSIARDATTSRIIYTIRPGKALAGAQAWLATQEGAHEITIVSDFQAGAVDSASIASLARDIRIELRALQPASGAPVAAPRYSGDVELLASAQDDELARATLAAAYAAGAPHGLSRSVAVVFPSYPGLSSLDTAIHDAWMITALAAIRRDTTVTAAFAMLDTTRAIRAATDARGRLLILSPTPPGTLQSAALVYATLDAMAPVPDVAEMDPSRIRTDRLAHWERRPSSVLRAPDRDARPIARWFWIAVVALLGVETYVRRTRPVRHDVMHGEVDRAA
jgi:hypothetical protein